MPKILRKLCARDLAITMQAKPLGRQAREKRMYHGSFGIGLVARLGQSEEIPARTLAASSSAITSAGIQEIRLAHRGGISMWPFDFNNRLKKPRALTRMRHPSPSTRISPKNSKTRYACWSTFPCGVRQAVTQVAFARSDPDGGRVRESGRTKPSEEEPIFTEVLRQNYYSCLRIKIQEGVPSKLV